MSLRNRIYVLLGAAMCLPAPTHSADWIVAKINQPAGYMVDCKNWLVLRRDSEIPNRNWVSIGPHARIVLQPQKDQLMLQPGTMSGAFHPDQGCDTSESECGVG